MAKKNPPSTGTPSNGKSTGKGRTGKTKGGTTYTPDKLNVVLKDRKTTMPPLTGPADPKRPPGGPPADGFEQQLNTLLRYDRTPLHLIGYVTAQQAADDKSLWFAQAPEYVQRTAIMQNAGATILTNLPYTGDDLLTRLRRVMAMQRWMDESLKFMALVGHTLRTERADLVRMCDIVVTETDLSILRPTLPDELRTDLMMLIEFPLQIWNERNAQIQKLKGDNQAAADELDQVEQELAELQAGQGQPAQTPPASTPPPRVVPLPIQGQAPRTPRGRGNGSRNTSR